MSDGPPDLGDKVDVQALWAKYEDIATHFNDLLLRLRSQGLAGIAAISTLVGIFNKADSNAQSDWLAATCIFVALAFFWIAIACLDLLYYNKLLEGAIAALLDLERKIASSAYNGIRMTTTIDAEFKRSRLGKVVSRFYGVPIFYAVVLATIAIGAVFSYDMYCGTVLYP